MSKAVNFDGFSGRRVGRISPTHISTICLNWKISTTCPEIWLWWSLLTSMDDPCRQSYVQYGECLVYLQYMIVGFFCGTWPLHPWFFDVFLPIFPTGSVWRIRISARAVRLVPQFRTNPCPLFSKNPYIWWLAIQPSSYSAVVHITWWSKSSWDLSLTCI